MHRGYIKLYRKIDESWLWKERNKKLSKLEAWIDLLFKANFTEGNEFCVDNQIIRQKRGEVFTSQLQLSIDWNWTRNKVKSFLDLLQSDGKITYEPSNKYTRIFLINWDKYNAESELKEQQTNQQSLNRPAIVEQRLGIINNDKNNKNDNNNIDTKNYSHKYPISSFTPITSEDARCLEIATWLGESHLDYMIGVRKKYGMQILEMAWANMKELKNAHFESKPRYFNNEVLKLIKPYLTKTI